ncbi:unnamed protein product [Ceratitis capitata]|uniref:(Mediterranean fruit fly) hypothetical protein n=1 Tax=Ceratitis capitata TaxID=7213 RepID=A0A811V4M3_CERCA|nr:unnamed protein product [Ceratitis capitata]
MLSVKAARYHHHHRLLGRMSNINCLLAEKWHSHFATYDYAYNNNSEQTTGNKQFKLGRNLSEVDKKTTTNQNKYEVQEKRKKYQNSKKTKCKKIEKGQSKISKCTVE